MLFGHTDVPSILKMPAVTFLTLLNEGHKLDIYEKKFRLSAAAYPHMQEDDQKALLQALALPDDILADILEDEQVDDVNKISDLIREANGN